MKAMDRLPRTCSVNVVLAPDDGPLPAPRQSLRQTLAEMLGELWHCRDLLWQMTLRDLRVRYKQALIGAGWALLMPTLIVLAGFVVKYAMAQVAGLPLETRTLAVVVLKALPWGLFVGAVGFATTSLTSNLNLVTKIYFPREVFPLACVLTQLVDTSLASVAAGLLLLALGAGVLSPALLWILPLTLLAVALTAGACLFLSCANLFFRDVKYLVQVFLTFGIFFTPVFFDADNLGPAGCPLVMLNPLAPILEGLRLAVFEGHDLLHVWYATTAQGQSFVAWHPAYLALTAAWALPGTLAAWILFHRLEFVYAEHI
jgi:ABC-type polysaccharide/polyol phosphate export permease